MPNLEAWQATLLFLLGASLILYLARHVDTPDDPDAEP